ncbi:MAG: exodeoxyribonuclease VII small subunit [Planctomycetaceae bacterium]|nr:exodeoxyribonuclease VII small subunit [Planctomycetaceae bacterium]
MAKKTRRKNEDQPAEPPRFEEAASELETIIDRLEEGDIPLEESLEAYGRGRELLARCRSILDAAATEIAEVDLETGEAASDEDA